MAPPQQVAALLLALSLRLRRVAVATLVTTTLAPLTGCEVDSSDLHELRTPSRTTFPNQAGPVLATRCGDYACHGNAMRPFALYEVGRRRLSDADGFTSNPLTEAELDANYNATLGFLDADRARETTLIRKALGVGGEGGHKGGAVFAAPSDPECRALLDWIKGDAP